MRAYSVKAAADEACGLVVWSDRPTQAASLFLGGFDYEGLAFAPDGPLAVEDVTAALAGRFVPAAPRPHIDRRPAVERAVGHRYDGDATCHACGLAEMGGEFPVCDRCLRCAACGCVCGDLPADA